MRLNEISGRYYLINKEEKLNEKEDFVVGVELVTGGGFSAGLLCPSRGGSGNATTEPL